MPINYTYNYAEVARDAGFKLKLFNDGPMDWRAAGSLEIERLLRDQCFEQIDGILQHLCEAPLGGMLQSNILDTAIAKYFVISQMAIQYLVFCREFLDESIRDLRESHISSSLELAKCKKSLSDATNEVVILHRRLTQMEAIHKVVYPCHLCSKSFVNNESLNVHLTRKHHAQMHHSTPDRGSCGDGQSPHSRDNDITLINTVKMELEIKQLKERLNVAEREIRDKNSFGKKSDSSAEEASTPKSTKSVGIQSNLSESKESNSENIDELQELQEQLAIMYEKLDELEKWKEEQETCNAAMYTELNQKVAELSATLHQKETQGDIGELHEQFVKDMELIVMEKANEINKTTAAKIEKVTQRMESMCKDKLADFEKKIKKLHSEQKAVSAMPSKDLGNSATKQSSGSETEPEKVTRPPSAIPKLITNSGTGSRELKKQTYVKKPLVKSTSAQSLSSVDSNTFVAEAHEAAVKNAAAFIEPLNLPVSNSSASDISDGEEESIDEEMDDRRELDAEEDDDAEDTDGDVEDLQAEERRENAVSSESDGEDAEELRRQLTALEKTRLKKTAPLKPPRVFSRKDSKRMVQKRLTDLGVDIRMKEISASSAKRINSELTMQRSQMKLKDSKFIAARNKIWKFVDNLCSNKSPTAEAVLNATEPLQPLRSLKSMYKRANVEQSEEEDDDEDAVVKEIDNVDQPAPTTSFNFARDSDFKDTLEKLLSTTATQPLQMEPSKPKPMPRKRVMFNTHNEHSDAIRDRSEAQSSGLQF